MIRTKDRWREPRRRKWRETKGKTCIKIDKNFTTTANMTGTDPDCWEWSRSVPPSTGWVIIVSIASCSSWETISWVWLSPSPPEEHTVHQRRVMVLTTSLAMCKYITWPSPTRNANCMNSSLPEVFFSALLSCCLINKSNITTLTNNDCYIAIFTNCFNLFIRRILDTFNFTFNSVIAIYTSINIYEQRLVFTYVI